MKLLDFFRMWVMVVSGGCLFWFAEVWRQAGFGDGTVRIATNLFGENRFETVMLAFFGAVLVVFALLDLKKWVKERRSGNEAKPF